MLRVLLLSLVAVILLVCRAQEDEQECKSTNCVAPKCYCRTQLNPFLEKYNIQVTDLPQFVMLTFDDAINLNNKNFYDSLLDPRKNLGNNCPITATFYVTHEYNNYFLTNDLYRKNHEVASHSITHSFNTDEWMKKKQADWKEEMDGMRQMLVKYGGIPKNQIKGIRVPFLQSNGDETFQMLKSDNFLYDSSMATRDHTHPPMWPYTLDLGFDQDCVIDPCPVKKYPGLWEVPLVSLWRDREVYPGVFQPSPCAMTDACLPVPTTAEQTKAYLLENFNRHYSNAEATRAPFPVFLHEAWLQDPERKAGYLAFVDELLKKKDVYFVTVQDVIEFMQNPVNKTTYEKKTCRKNPPPQACSVNTCTYKAHANFLSERIMVSCFKCPRTYPWLKNIS